MQAINSGDTAWVLASAALVLFMTPGLAIFYGGMVRAKSALNMMMMSFAAMALQQSSGFSTVTHSPSVNRKAALSETSITLGFPQHSIK